MESIKKNAMHGGALSKCEWLIRLAVAVVGAGSFVMAVCSILYLVKEAALEGQVSLGKVVGSVWHAAKFSLIAVLCLVLHNILTRLRAIEATVKKAPDQAQD